MSFTPHEVYARCLLPRAPGYPLWTPQLNAELCESYQLEGLKIGDVGIVSPIDGSFDVLFNITLPHNEQPYPNLVRESFVPVTLDPEADFATQPRAVAAHGLISSASVRLASKVIHNRDQTPSRADYEFTLSVEDGAVLILPEGSQSRDLRNEKRFLGEAIRHGINWYTCATEKAGRLINNDSLYLITGFHKARSWSLGAAERDGPNFQDQRSVKFKIGQIHENDVAAEAYLWLTTYGFTERVGPTNPYEIPNHIHDEKLRRGVNQTVFIRGFRITVNKILFLKTISVKTRQGTFFGFGTYVDNLRSSGLSDSTQPSGTESPTDNTVEQDSSTDNSQLYMNTHMRIDRVPDVAQSFHPGDSINQYMLKKEPHAMVAITHDNLWIEMLQGGILKLPDFSEENRLQEVLSKNYQMIMKDGAVYLQKDPPQDHLFSYPFSTDLSPPSILSQSHVSSPKPKSLLTATKRDEGYLSRAMRFLLESDSIPDKCTDPIWLLGVQHPGYEPPPSTMPDRHPSDNPRRTSSFRSDLSSSPAPNWPPAFYADFTSRIWLTYRSQFLPIRDSNLSSLDADLTSGAQFTTPPIARPRKWGIGEKGWTSDVGWGCMLRTGQSLLANTLLHFHLGREWRPPLHPVRTKEFATYVQIITWFLDSPLPQAPFSVHRMALAGKDLGKDVGQWFGPSTAAYAIKTLVPAFPEAGLGVAVAVDGVVYQSDVYTASGVRFGSPHRRARSSWGGCGVLVLIGTRLGVSGINPIYYEPIKALYTFPQSVGIAGGRPSSSYHIVGSQADNIFYLDPHHTRPTVPLRPQPPSSTDEYPSVGRGNTSDDASDRRAATRSRGGHPSYSHHPGTSTSSYHSPLSTFPLQRQLSTGSSVSSLGFTDGRTSCAASSLSSQHPSHWENESMCVSASPHFDGLDLDLHDVKGENLDALAEHYVTQYSAAELRTFHCDHVRKMPLSGLDPSILIGFLCKEEKDWIDLRQRINELNAKYKTIFDIQDEPPSWSGSDGFMGVEPIFDPDGVEGPDPEEEDDMEFFDTHSSPVSPMDTSVESGNKSSKGDVGVFYRARMGLFRKSDLKEIDEFEDDEGDQE